MKNIFVSPRKLFWLLRYLNLCSEFLATQESSLIRKLRKVSKLMTPQTEQQIITIHILPDLSRNKGSRTVKFDLFIEYNIENNFSWKIKQKMWWRNQFETFFIKIKIKHISGSKVWTFIQFLTAALKITAVQQSLTLATVFVAAERLRRTVNTTANIKMQH